ncbi:hypothetical protein EV183_005583, partial [Coemansia sp. RSA 2336]
ILYVSSGCVEALGFTPEYILEHGGTNYIADSFSTSDYAHIYNNKHTGSSDDSSVYMLYLYLRNSDNVPVLHQITSFVCESCVICINRVYPDAVFADHRELQAQELDGNMRQINVTRSRQVLLEAERRANARGAASRRIYTYGQQPRAAVMLENTAFADAEQEARRLHGTLIMFATSSISSLVDIDNIDLVNFPFIKLVAPEDVVRVSRYLTKVAGSSRVHFEKFSLLRQPHVLESAGEGSGRMVVESLGAASQDGIVLLLRKVKQVPAPQHNTVGSYLRSIDVEASDSDYVSLAELVSSEPETTDTPANWDILP